MIQSLLQNLNISPNELQQAAIAAISKPQDVVLLSPTGSGKTLAFLLPLLAKLQHPGEGVQALIVVPTRELALQIEEVIRSTQSGLKVTCCYGGHSAQVEERSLSQSPELVVGTPGRISFHIREENLQAQAIQYLVLDEFDKSLELGFEDEMSFILSALSGLQQKVLTSATSMTEFPAFLNLQQHEEISFLNQKNADAGLDTRIIRIPSKEKLDSLIFLLSQAPQEASMVFCNHREVVGRLADMLAERGLWCGVYHGGLEQKDREKVLIKFRNQSINILITTDLASRGLDIPEISQVIHYQIPHNQEAYVHRNGRTARMHAEGVSYLLLSDDEYAPAYTTDSSEETLDIQHLSALPMPAWVTFYIAAGKKDKINKVDIAGLFYKKANLQKDDLGRIDVQDFMSYVAVKRSIARKVLASIAQEKIKGRKYKIGIDE